jgi:flagellar hook-basal body complex protein FliE
MSINGVSVNKLANIEILSNREESGKSVKAVGDSSFVAEMGKAIKAVDASQKEADRVMEEGALKGPEDIHEAMIKLQEAEISLRLFMQVKNKVIDAYREIMRMQV